LHIGVALVNKQPGFVTDDAPGVDDIVERVFPAVGGEFFPVGGCKASAAFGFDGAELYDTRPIAIEDGVVAVAGVDEVGVVAGAADQRVVVRAALEGVVACVADQEVGLAATRHPVGADAADHEGFAGVCGGAHADCARLYEPVGACGQELQDDAVLFEGEGVEVVLEIQLPALGAGQRSRHIGAVEADAAGDGAEQGLANLVALAFS